MKQLFLSHAEEDVASSGSSISHFISDNPLLAALFASAIILLILSALVLTIGKSADKHKKEETGSHESDSG